MGLRVLVFGSSSISIIVVRTLARAVRFPVRSFRTMVSASILEASCQSRALPEYVASDTPSYARRFDVTVTGLSCFSMAGMRVCSVPVPFFCGLMMLRTSVSATNFWVDGDTWILRACTVNCEFSTMGPAPGSASDGDRSSWSRSML